MAVSKVGQTNPAAGTGVVRPLYGTFIRDQVAQYRAMLSTTLNDLKKDIQAGDPKGKPVVGDGKLQGSELAKAKKAAVAVNNAIKALKPVFGTSFPKVTPQAAANALGRTGNVGVPIAMYGIVFADDLRKYRSEITANISQIKDGITNGELTGDAKKEATKAVRSLTSALNALKTAQPW